MSETGERKESNTDAPPKEGASLRLSFRKRIPKVFPEPETRTVTRLSQPKKRPGDIKYIYPSDEIKHPNPTNFQVGVLPSSRRTEMSRSFRFIEDLKVGRCRAVLIESNNFKAYVSFPSIEKDRWYLHYRTMEQGSGQDIILGNITVVNLRVGENIIEDLQLKLLVGQDHSVTVSSTVQKPITSAITTASSDFAHAYQMGGVPAQVKKEKIFLTRVKPGQKPDPQQTQQDKKDEAQEPDFEFSKPSTDWEQLTRHQSERLEHLLGDMAEGVTVRTNPDTGRIQLQFPRFEGEFSYSYATQEKYAGTSRLVHEKTARQVDGNLIRLRHDEKMQETLWKIIAGEGELDAWYYAKELNLLQRMSPGRFYRLSTPEKQAIIDSFKDTSSLCKEMIDLFLNWGEVSDEELRHIYSDKPEAWTLRQ